MGIIEVKNIIQHEDVGIGEGEDVPLLRTIARFNVKNKSITRRIYENENNGTRQWRQRRLLRYHSADY